MADRWVKTNCLLASATAFWLTALSPVPAIAKGVSYSLALVASVQLVQESRRLIVQDARRAALAAMNQELEQTEFALHTQQQEQALYEVYGDAPTYPPEVDRELKTSLEHLYKEPSADRSGETSTSTSQEKAFYLAIKSLLEVKGKTHVIEEIFKMGGRQWNEAERLLQQILEEGQRNGW
ncbi:hypothetical protein [Nostoc sp. 'Peltigera membranacea cyanobiont' 232]|uniref:hypothetical protein n=1 Tax=Nostoc sp. 'Peltigera membranacea cyanobiont' 232 TaxID=2014531 RepID=UPI000B95C358|nr:hypothetical protein [Nostoc sp. 'Peltigera membranacea cyanobiont' 232]OYE02962.1 hypothetical protein CDG79_21075 [Nostoc sp. 'Peltigera membranacea cyanobiont' 232]